MFKSKAPEKDTSATASTPEVVERTVQEQHSGVEQHLARLEPTKPGTGSCIGSGMSIVGNIECNGPAQVFGRIQGELRASDLLIGDGAQIERVENPTDPSSVDAKGPRKEDMQDSALAPYLHRVEGSVSTEWSESTAEPKH